MKKYLLLFILPLALVGCSKTPTLENGQEVVAEINGKQFTAEDLFEELISEYGTASLVNLIDKYIYNEEATDEMIETATLAAKSDVEGYKAMSSMQGYDWNDFLYGYGFKNETEFLEVLIESALQEIVITEYIKTDVIHEDEIIEYYEDNVFGQADVRHVLFIGSATDDMDEDEALEAAYDEAMKFISDIKNSDNMEDSIIEIAKEYSEDTGSAVNGGLIEDVDNNSGLVTEFYEAVLELEVGEVTAEPIKTQYGYHIIYKISQDDKPSLDDSEEMILDVLASAIMSDDNAIFIYAAALREKYNIKIYNKTIDDNYKYSLSTVK